MKNYFFINKINFIENEKNNCLYFLNKKKKVLFKNSSYFNFILNSKKFFLKNNFIQINTPEIENFNYNFKLLNIFKKDFKGSLYFKNKILRTHTSCFQNRLFKNYFINSNFFNIGKVYRNDYDNIHLPCFYQIDFLIIKNFKILEFILSFFSNSFKKKFFFKIRKTKFPFTINSFEIDILNNFEWIELAGYGLSNQNILMNNNLKKKIIAGGIGLDRLFFILKKKFHIKSIYD
ncbi:hypothetical protein [Candidatus Carsonella ruddii]|uniref:tRNA ligase subunit PheS family protein n=1 Tax=Carsonella ruddii TaxID=114186 RepID=UPI001B3C5A1A